MTPTLRPNPAHAHSPQPGARPRRLRLLPASRRLPATAGTAGRSVVDAAPQQRRQATSNWLTHGRTYDEQEVLAVEQSAPRNIKQLGLAWYLDPRHGPRARATAAGDRRVMYRPARGARSGRRRRDRQAALAVTRVFRERPGSGLLRRGEPRRGRGTARLVGTLMAPVAPTPDRQRAWSVVTVDQSALHDHGRAPHVKGKVLIGNGGAGVRSPRLHFRLRRRHRQARWRFIRCPAIRRSPSSHHLTNRLSILRVVEAGRRHGLGFGGVRPGARSPLHRYREWFAVEPARPEREPTTTVPFRRSSPCVRHRRIRWHYQETPGEEWDYGDAAHRRVI